MPPDPAHTAARRARRHFLRTATAAAWPLGGLTGLGATPATAAVPPGDPWRHAQAIIDHLALPRPFRAQDYRVTDFGALPCQRSTVRGQVGHAGEIGDCVTPAPGAFDCRAAFASAIAACQAEGGGRVLIPRGDWYCAGPLVLRSGVHVHLQAGARIFFSPRPEDYARHGDVDCGANGRLVRTRWQSNDCLNFASMVYAHGQDHIALTGEDWTSILDGQGGVPFDAQVGPTCWWDWKGRDRTLNERGEPIDGRAVAALNSATPNPANPASLAALAPWLGEAERAALESPGQRWRADEFFLPALSEAGVPLAQRVFGLGHRLRPSMVHLLDCTNVLLQGYQVTNTPFWQHHPVHCRNLVLRGVYANSLGPNNDGFDPEACDQVLVEDCTFDTGDDCIAIKAGKNLDTQHGPSQNIVIQRCVMHSGHGAVTLGSEMAGGIQNVYAQQLVMENRHWASNPLNTAIRLKTNMNRGGWLRNFHVRDVRIPNGVQTTPSFYATLPGSPIASRTVATAGGAVVTFDCDYTPLADTLRTRPPAVSNVHISQVRVGNVPAQGRQLSCYQAIVVLGPVASDYNGRGPMPAVLPVQDVTVSDCDFGTPAQTAQPFFIYNADAVLLKNVVVAGQTLNTRLVALPGAASEVTPK